MRKVSVIVPVYNGERFLSDAVESVLNQTFRDYEIIIVNDGSVDRSGMIADRYAVRFPGLVRCLHRENAGPGAARNAGIRVAEGRYIAFLDGDDAWLPGKLEQQIAVMDRDRDIGLIYCDNYFTDDARNVVKEYRRQVSFYRGMIADRLFQHYIILTSGAVVRRECFDTVGCFREDIRTGEDYDFFLRLSYRYRIDWVEERLFARRTVAGSMSNSDDMTVMANDLDVLHRFVREHPGFYSEFRKIVADRLGAYHFSLGYTGIRAGRNLLGARHLISSLRYRVHPKALKCLLMAPFPYSVFKALKQRI